MPKLGKDLKDHLPKPKFHVLPSKGKFDLYLKKLILYINIKLDIQLLLVGEMTSITLLLVFIASNHIVLLEN
jgi:hypothetical protein